MNSGNILIFLMLISFVFSIQSQNVKYEILTKQKVKETKRVSDNRLVIEGKNYDSIAVDAFENLKNLTSLSLIGNQLKSIGENTFKNLPNLKELFLHRNKIEYIHENAFKSLTKLENLFLSNNKLKVIETKVFENLKNLKELNLFNNPITEIQQNAFSTLKNLENLDLGNNNLKVIPNNLFSNLTNLKALTLSRNGFKQINLGWFYGLKNLTKLVLTLDELKSFNFEIFSKSPLLKQVIDSPELDTYGMCYIDNEFKDCINKVLNNMRNNASIVSNTTQEYCGQDTSACKKLTKLIMAENSSSIVKLNYNFIITCISLLYFQLFLDKHCINELCGF